MALRTWPRHDDHPRMHHLLRHALRSWSFLRTASSGPCPACGERARSPMCESCRRASLISATAWLAHVDGLALHFAGAYHGAAPRNSLSPLGRTLLAFKDRGDRYAGRCLVRLVADRAGPALERIDAIVPVPSDLQRLRQRGFSAAAWLAAGTARRHGLPLLDGALGRAAGRPPQRGLSGAARRANARGALLLGATAVRGYAIALIDDVATTGATLHEAAAALRQAGARHVQAIVLACADEDLVQRCRSKTDDAGTNAICARRP